MRNNVRTSLCAAIAACATTVIAAQTTSAPQTSPSAADQKTLVVVGCLKEAPSSSLPAATGAAGAAGAVPSDAAPAPKYVLINATTPPADASGAATTTGTTGTTSAAGATSTTGTAGASTTAAPASGTQTYRLIANASALTPHVGKKVELTGTLEPAASASSESTPASDANANSPVLRVQSGKIVAASCTE